MSNTSLENLTNLNCIKCKEPATTLLIDLLSGTKLPHCGTHWGMFCGYIVEQELKKVLMQQEIEQKLNHKAGKGKQTD